MYRTLAALTSALLVFLSVAAQADPADGAMPLPAASAAALSLSHLFVQVVDTDATIDFWVRGLGGELESDEELAAPALDAMFGRSGVRIRDTFIRVGGIRLHTIETLDVPRSFDEAPAATPQIALGLGGISFHVPDLDAAHARAKREGRNPTGIFEFTDIAEPVRMFFLESPNRIRVEMIGEVR